MTTVLEPLSLSPEGEGFNPGERHGAPLPSNPTLRKLIKETGILHTRLHRETVHVRIACELRDAYSEVVILGSRPHAVPKGGVSCVGSLF
jgi:hypothetical protein